MSSKPAIVFVLGGPGAGKGTQCDRIVKEFGFVHLSAGDLLRAERATGSEVANLINEYINQGKIVPVEITIALLDKAMTASGKNKFLIDGFPRNVENLFGFERVMGDKVDVKFVLHLDCPTETCIERVLERGKSSGRGDDNIEVLRKRLATFHEETKEVLEIFESRGLVRKVSSIACVDVVFTDVARAFQDL